MPGRSTRPSSSSTARLARSGNPGSKATRSRAPSALRARLGRLRLAALDVPGAAAIEPETTCVETLLLRFELALARGALGDGTAAFGALRDFPETPPLEVALAEAALARVER